MSEIIVLHEYGSPSHYIALCELAQQNGYKISFYEMNLKSQLKRSVFRPWKIFRFLRNTFFLLTVSLWKKRKIVVGIAPYNAFLTKLMKKLRNHDVYYHTSYTCWDGSRAAHPTASNGVMRDWNVFTNVYVKCIFAVSEKTRKELVDNNYAPNDKIFVVNHSYKNLVENVDLYTRNRNFIFVGRVNEKKGIEELLEIFSHNPNIHLSIVGEGPLVGLVKEYSERCDNICYVGFVKCFENLIELYKRHSYLVMNSHRVGAWEELFGMSLVEGMSCGCVPIATSHPGPMEIIEHGKTGFLCEEGMIRQMIDAAVGMSNEEYDAMRKNSILKGQSFYCKNIAKRWSSILL